MLPGDAIGKVFRGRYTREILIINTLPNLQERYQEGCSINQTSSTKRVIICSSRVLSMVAHCVEKFLRSWALSVNVVDHLSSESIVKSGVSAWTSSIHDS